MALIPDTKANQKPITHGTFDSMFNDRTRSESAYVSLRTGAPSLKVECKIVSSAYATAIGTPGGSTV